MAGEGEGWGATLIARDDYRLIEGYMSKLDDLKEIRRGIGIILMGVGAYFGDLLRKYPEFISNGEVLAFWSSGIIMLGMLLFIIGLSFYMWREQK